MNIDQAAEVIRNGGIVAFPTETVYGLGADAWNPTSITKVFEAKGRPSDNPLIVHVASEEDIHDFAIDIPDKAHQLIEEFWPGPLTLVLKKRPEVLDAVTAGLDTVALRMPNHEIALELIRNTGPLVAPSANHSGKPSPTKAEHVIDDFGKDLLVLDGKATKIGLESTVVDLTDTFPAILRPGSISRKEIEELLGGFVEESFFHHLKNPRSPGQKYSHYRPQAKVRWLGEHELAEHSHALYLLQSGKKDSVNNVLYSGDLKILAQELFDRFRQADLEGYEEVVIEHLDVNHPLYAALNNRISKAIGI
jgi:L-threonylcarbamoyladenylate synthase